MFKIVLKSFVARPSAFESNSDGEFDALNDGPGGDHSP